MSICSPSVTRKPAGRLNGRGGSEPEVRDDTLDVTVIDRVQEYLKQISEITSKVPDQVSIIVISSGVHLLFAPHLSSGSEVSDNSLPDHKQLDDDSAGICGQPDQGGAGQDQGPVPSDQHGPGAADQGYRGAEQSGSQGRKIVTLINNSVSMIIISSGSGSS